MCKAKKKKKKKEKRRNKEKAGMKSDFYAINSVVKFDPIGTQYITKPAGTFLNES